jgi:hypothetical protein
MAGFQRIVDRERDNKGRCLFVAMPDVVGCARRTLEVFKIIAHQFHTWPIALVCQDGMESLPMPWDSISAIFIGGSTQWKMSQHVTHLIKAAQILGKHTHVGRVNSPDRFRHFNDMGVDTCDGSGVSRYDHMLDAICESLREDSTPLLDDAERVEAKP